MKNKKMSKFLKRLIIFASVVAALIITVIIILDYKIKPTMNAAAEMRVQYYAVEIINNAVKEVINEYPDLSTLVDVVMDDDGHVKLIKADSIAMNRLSTLVSERAQQKMLVLEDVKLSIPIGSILSNGLLSGKGPNLKVSMMPAGSVNTDFSTEFENAGINQTRHRVYMTVTANIRIVAPLSGSTISVISRVPITEMIIVGDVPDTYINVPSLDNAMDLIP